MRSHSVLIGLVIVALVARVGATAARADGEAGLVVQDGDTVRTFCVSFAGDGISGDQLLKAAGQAFAAYGSGSGLALCSIQDQGCSDSGSFSSCFCKCRGSDCTYWAFFTRGYGKNWVYSSLAFNLLKARDGDVHGWKWGAGGPNSAPAPQDITFDQICGHAPSVATVAQQPPATAANPPPAASATAPAQATEAAGATASAGVNLVPSPSTTATPLVTISSSPSPSAAPAPTRAAIPSAVDSSSRSPGRDTIIAFGSVVGVLLTAIAGTALWRSRHG